MSLELKNTILGEEINKIRKELPKLSDLEDDALFNLVCFKYFYNNGELSYADYKNIYTDGKNDGGIDFITTYEPDNQSSTLLFAQCKLWETPNGKRDIVNWYNKMDITIKSFKTNKKSDDYNAKLTKIITDRLDEAKDEGYFEELVVFIYSDINDKLEREVREEIEKTTDISKNLEDYQISFITKKMIDNQITTINDGRTSVAKDKIRLFKEDGNISKIIKYQENGLLTTISAKDLKRLYMSHKFEGLFEQNLRYYRPNKKIDDKIKESINKNKKNFWYFNNGIIIGCSDFDPNGDNITLWDFSIINGGQTTVLVGDYYEGEEDFAIPCKIIKGDNYEFLAQVAEASNSQKAISDADLKANAPEQISLKKLLEEKEIYLVIKRGNVGSKKSRDISKPQNYKQKTWDKINNEKLGQLILSFVFQEPGTARSNKKGIFSTNTIYNKIFKNKEIRDTELLKSLIKLYEYVEKFENVIDYELDTDENSIIQYGKLFIFAVIGFIIKIEKNLIDTNYCNDDKLWENELQRQVPKGNIFANYKEDDFEIILNGLIQKIIGLIKESHQLYDKESTYTNFFKTNPKYRNYILKRVIDVLLKNPIERKRFKEDYLKIFNI